MCKAAPQK